MTGRQKRKLKSKAFRAGWREGWAAAEKHFRETDWGPQPPYTPEYEHTLALEDLLGITARGRVPSPTDAQENVFRKLRAHAFQNKAEAYANKRRYWDHFEDVFDDLHWEDDR